MPGQRHSLGLNDITTFAPPCMTPERALEIYEPAFKRAVEYVTKCKILGNFLEFGTFHGYTARTLAEQMKINGTLSELYLFDSWEGFPAMVGVDENCPEAKAHLWRQGDCNPIIVDPQEAIKFYLNLIIPHRVHTVKGFYEKTVPSQLPEGPAALVHIDCDLYESTRHVLTNLLAAGKIQQGTVILFDDWNNNFASNEFGERKAAADAFNIYYDILYSLEPWFTYGWSGAAFIVQKEEIPF